MTQNKDTSIADMNRTIAEFIGGEVREIWRIQDKATYAWTGEIAKQWRREKMGIDVGEAILIEHLRFHSDWSWLMPVGKKIYDYLQQDLKKRPPNTCTEGDLLEVDIYCALKEYDILKTHKAIYHFICWYNTTLKKEL